MATMWNSPALVFILCFAGLLLAEYIGAAFRLRISPLGENQRADFDLVLTSTLTLLGLIIGFTFSMAISRYDQRKNYEEEEANAIGTTYLRAELLPQQDAAHVQVLLKNYLQQRIQFYTALDREKASQINTETATTQDQMWAAVRAPALAWPTPVSALVLSSMNDVINAQGYTQAAWWNRIPIPAWELMVIIAICCSLLIGYRSHQQRPILFVVLPLAISISFALIADIDSPRGGLIHVIPQNLISLASGLR
jgi:hypothetical protein